MSTLTNSSHQADNDTVDAGLWALIASSLRLCCHCLSSFHSVVTFVGVCLFSDDNDKHYMMPKTCKISSQN